MLASFKPCTFSAPLKTEKAIVYFVVLHQEYVSCPVRKELRNTYTYTLTHKPVHMQNCTASCRHTADYYRGWKRAFSMLEKKRDVNLVHLKIIQDEARRTN